MAHTFGRGIKSLAVDLAVLELAFVTGAVLPGVDAFSAWFAFYPFAHIAVRSSRFAVPLRQFGGFIAAALIRAAKIQRKVLVAAIGHGRSGQRKQRRENRRHPYGRFHRYAPDGLSKVGTVKTGHAVRACPVRLTAVPTSALGVGFRPVESASQSSLPSGKAIALASPVNFRMSIPLPMRSTM